MKKILFILLAHFTYQTIFSQVDFDSQTNQQRLQSLQIASERNIDLEKEALGSPYIPIEFMPVKIKGFDESIFSARFNAFNGEMQVNIDSKIIALNVNQDIEVVFLSNKTTYKALNYKNYNGIDTRGFLVVIRETTNFSLYRKETVSYQQKKAAKTSYDKDKPAKFVKESDSFYIKKNGVIEYLPNKKKDLLKQYSKNATSIKSFLKENKISLKDESDLIKLAQFLVTL